MKEYSLGLYEKALPDFSWKEKFEIAKELGFDFIEMSIDESEIKQSRLDMSIEERKKLKDLMFEEGIHIESICLSAHRKYPLGSEDLEIQKISLSIGYKCVLLAKDLGIRHIQIAGYDVYYEKSNEITRKNFLINLEKFVRFASKNGVILGFETMETNFMNTITKAQQYVSYINSPYLKIYPDCGNVINAYNNNLDAVRSELTNYSSLIIALHLKEVVPKKFREIQFGTGIVDFEKVIETSISNGINRFVMECWYTGSNNWKKELKRDFNMLSSILEKETKC